MATLSGSSTVHTWTWVALAASRDELGALLARHSGQLKRAVTDQTVLAGIGNAYSGEILNTARSSRTHSSLMRLLLASPLLILLAWQQS